MIHGSVPIRSTSEGCFPDATDPFETGNPTRIHSAMQRWLLCSQGSVENREAVPYHSPGSQSAPWVPNHARPGTAKRFYTVFTLRHRFRGTLSSFHGCDVPCLCNCSAVERSRDGTDPIERYRHVRASTGPTPTHLGNPLPLSNRFAVPAFALDGYPGCASRPWALDSNRFAVPVPPWSRCNTDDHKAGV